MVVTLQHFAKLVLELYISLN